jgi:hypothetical protein
MHDYLMSRLSQERMRDFLSEAERARMAREAAKLKAESRAARRRLTLRAGLGILLGAYRRRPRRNPA